jgi:hypothetical protein
MNYFERSSYPSTVGPAAANRTPPGMSNVTRFVTDGLVAPLLQGLGQAAVNVAESMGGLTARRAGVDSNRARRCECGCGAEDSCHCTCCIVDADLVLYAFAGERRIITISVDNERRRILPIKLTFSGFTTHLGVAAPVKGTLLSPAEFNLAPCASQAVAIVVDTALGAAAGVETIPDVEECTVYYANLQIDGCGNRPLRIAVAILPRDCGAYKVDCNNCCC